MGWLDDLENRAAARLPQAVHDYYRHGAADELTVAEAAPAWDRLRLRPHALRDVTTVDTRLTALGADLATPVLIAPTTLQRHAHPDGETAMARGAAAAGTLMCVSSNAGTPFADIAAARAPWWLQLYVLRDRDLTRHLLDRAVAAGARAIVLTADTPVVAAKPPAADTVWRLTPPDYYLLPNLPADRRRRALAEAAAEAEADDTDLDKATDLTADTIRRLRDHTGLPVAVKGILRADDALACADAGAAAVIVSNHGGRQLDGALATATALPEIARALADRDTELYVDGGIRTGRHILSALALGARAVLVGRPALWGLAADGPQGVTAVVDRLTAELRQAMTLAGTPDLASLTPDLVVTPS